MTTSQPTYPASASSPSFRQRPMHHPVFSLGDLPPTRRSYAQYRRRGVLRSRAIAIAAIVTFLIVMLASNVGADAGPVKTVSHHVSSGETLWGLASALTPQGESVWVYISMLKELNNLESSNLQVDQVLLLPVTGS